MFEMIGVLIVALVFFGASGILGGVYVLIAWLIIRPVHHVVRMRRLILAACIPPIFAGYIAVCLIGFSIFVRGDAGMLFGDIYEPLPNHYVLTALGKMPDYGIIDRHACQSCQPRLIGYVGRIAVDGPLVFGAYSHMFSQPRQDEATMEGFFSFDTRNQSVHNFGTLPQLNAFAGHPIHLVDNQFFRSQEPSHRRIVVVERIVLFAPPGIGTLVFFFLLLRLRRKAKISEVL